MKIGMNSLFLQHPTNGSGQYLLNLLKALADVDPHNEYVLVGPRPVPQSVVTAFPYKVYPVTAFAAKSENVEKLVWEQFTGPQAARTEGVDIFHVPHFAPPLLPRTPTVVTIHDVIPLVLPAYRPDGKVKAYMSLIARAAHRASHIITISEHARSDIIRVLNIPAERISVIYQAIGSEYQPIKDPELLRQARARYGIGERFIFYLGGLDQRKNIAQLVRAFARVVHSLDDPTLQLFISGNPDKQRGPLFPDPRPIAESLGISDRIVYRFVDDADKPAIYSAASLFAFPSLYEGFGLTPLEAMGCGTPVVCSNRTSLPEVTGDAALSIDPDDTVAFANAMLSVLRDPGLQADLSARSLQRARHFNWHKTASETLAVYSDVVAKRKK